MPEIALFVEDHAHYLFLKALIHRLSVEYQQEVNLDWRNARRGHGMVIKELHQYLRDLRRGRNSFPDRLIVATDANCQGLMNRLREITDITQSVGIPTICAVPDPHIERWLLLDSSAFKQVFGKGCDMPDKKCERGRYKRKLVDAIRASGIDPNLGGIEFTDDIVNAMDLDSSANVDASFQRLLDELRAMFREWQRKG
ncbi:MAG: hypothetical protein WCP34_10720 [Pseudomonadota bacterium]